MFEIEPLIYVCCSIFVTHRIYNGNLLSLCLNILLSRQGKLLPPVELLSDQHLVSVVILGSCTVGLVNVSVSKTQKI